MKKRTLPAAAAGLLAVAGCFSVGSDADVNLDQTIRFELGDVGESCSGVKTVGATTTSYALSPDGTRCQLHVVYDGAFIDIQDLQKSLHDSVSDYPDKVTITFEKMTASIEDVSLTDQAHLAVTPPRIPHWDAQLEVAGQPVARLMGDDVPSLLAAVQNIDLSPAVAPLNQALANGQSLPCHGVADLSLDVSSIQRYLVGHPGVAIELHFTAHIHAHGEEDLTDLI
jgi:hypothetical protein